MKLEAHWQKKTWLVFILWPVSMLFRGLVFLRKKLYQYNLLASYKSKLPLIIVGNITVGGTGKTPVIIGLVNFLESQGYKPGVISRGYGGVAGDKPHLVKTADSPLRVGDEPLVIARNTNAPVVVCKQRKRSIQLIESELDCDVILSDDGLQHYAIQRDIEIVCVDSEKKFGNGFCLPAGPLREPEQRLKSVDFVLSKNTSKVSADYIELRAKNICALHNAQTQSLASLSGAKVHAVAGIGNPENFFMLLTAAGLNVYAHPFADHHNFTQSDFSFNDGLPILLTEKDAVKCQTLALENAWYVPVETYFSGDVLQRISRSVKHVIETRGL